MGTEMWDFFSQFQTDRLNIKRNPRKCFYNILKFSYPAILIKSQSIILPRIREPCMYDIIAYYELLFEFENIDFAALCTFRVLFLP